MAKILANDGIDSAGKKILAEAGIEVSIDKVPQEKLISPRARDVEAELVVHGLVDRAHDRVGRRQQAQEPRVERRSRGRQVSGAAVVPGGGGAGRRGHRGVEGQSDRTCPHHQDLAMDGTLIHGVDRTDKVACRESHKHVAEFLL